MGMRGGYNARLARLLRGSIGFAEVVGTGVGTLQTWQPMKVKEVLRLLYDDGWYVAVTRGSHRQFRHPVKSGRVTVAGKPSDDLAPGTLSSIFKQAGWKE